MKPYYENKSGSLFHADAIDIMAGSKKYDLVLTDPPYGILGNKGKAIGGGSYRGSTNNFDNSEISWDSCRIDKVYFELMRYISKNQIIWGANYYLDYLPPSRCYIVWYKRDQLPPRTFADCELAWASYDRNAVVYNCRWDGFIRDSRESKVKHPTQKALDVMMWCLQEFANPGQSIIDPFAGSGTSLLAAQRLGFTYTGVEINEKFCEIAAKRLEQDAAQLKLFAV